MKKAKDQIEKLIEKISEKIDDRDCIYDDRSDKWQESERGIDYSDNTQELQEVLENLEMTLESIETYLQ